MATTYAVNIPPHAGAAISFTEPPTSGDIAPCASQYSLLVVNPSANGNVTVSLPGTVDDGVLTVGPRVVTVPQGTSWLIPLLPNTYGSTVTITYTGTLTTVQVAVICTAGN